jgi:hypothetical protein
VLGGSVLLGEYERKQSETTLSISKKGKYENPGLRAVRREAWMSK